ncbi:3 beta-hydroxysteroid dehydrogenase/Delta 5--_4-isomerase [bacterium HR19]|nr:3 beta-hydroxysteroid dehydrogenase/Delta 5-->4-isomerase [bacterium HR19]
MEFHLVTGARGVLGRVLTLKLLRKGLRVRTLDLFYEPSFPKEVEQIIGDIRDPETCSRAVYGVEVVHHLAARMPQWGILGEKTLYEINVIGTKNLLSASIKAGVRRFVFASTAEIYGAQEKYPLYEDDEKLFTGTYSRNKWECEQMLFSYDKKGLIEGVALRMPMIFGPGFYHERSILLLFDLVRLNLPVVLTANGNAPFSCVHVEDASDAFVLSADNPEARGKAFNIATRTAPPISEVIRKFIRQVGSRSVLIPFPLPLLRFAIRVLLLLSRFLPFVYTPSELIPFALTGGWYSIERAQKILGYNPRYEPVECLTETYRWYFYERKRSYEERRLHGLP